MPPFNCLSHINNLKGSVIKFLWVRTTIFVISKKLEQGMTVTLLLTNAYLGYKNLLWKFYFMISYGLL